MLVLSDHSQNQPPKSLHYFVHVMSHLAPLIVGARVQLMDPSVISIVVLSWRAVASQMESVVFPCIPTSTPHPVVERRTRSFVLLGDPCPLPKSGSSVD